MLDEALKSQLKAYLEKGRSADRDSRCDRLEREIRRDGGLLTDIASLSDKITLIEQRDSTERTPSFALKSPGQDIDVRFAGIPLGHEFTSLVLALLQVGGHPPRVEQAIIDQIRDLDGDFRFETYFSLSCQNCPDVVQALNLMAVLNPRIKHIAVDGGVFPNEVEARQIMSVPAIYLNGELFAPGPHGCRADSRQDRHRSSGTQSRENQGPGAVRGSGDRRRPRGRRGRNLCRPQGAYAPALPPSASAARFSIRPRSKTSSPFATPTAPSSPPHSKSTSRNTASRS